MSGHTSYIKRHCPDTEQVRATMTAREAAVYLGISYWLILELVKRGELNCIKAGGRKLFRQCALDSWMSNQERGVVEHEIKLRRAK